MIYKIVKNQLIIRNNVYNVKKITYILNRKIHVFIDSNVKQDFIKENQVIASTL